ncbi:MAG: glycosyltransferase family 39 protein [Planctomycetota bacterium]
MTDPTPGSDTPGSDAPTRKPVRVPWFWRILVLAVVVRVAWAVLVPVVPVSDPGAYDTMARNLAAGHGYSLEPFREDANPDDFTPTAYWAVGAPAVYAAGFAVFGDTYAPVVAVNLIANVATIAFVMLLAARWLTPRHATAAGLCLALWPGQIGFTTLLASELLFAFGLLAAVYAWHRLEAGRGFVRVPVVGVLLGLTCLVRPTALLVPVLLVIVAVAQNKEGLRGVIKPTLHAGLAAVVMIAVVLPWSFRNQRALGEFVLVSANSGANFWMGNHPGTDGVYAVLPPETAAMSEVRRDAYLKDLALDYIKQDPAAFVQRTLIKAVKLHDRETIGVVWNAGGLEQRFGGDGFVGPLKLASTAYWWVMLGSGLGGMLLLWVRGGTVRGFFVMLFHPAVVYWGYFLTVHAIVVVQDRYHWPSVPFIAMLAALPIVAVCDLVRTRKAQAMGGAA